MNLNSYGNSNSTISSLHNLKADRLKNRDVITNQVELETIDEFCINNQIKEIDLLKIDIEGHELIALKGAINMLKALKINYIQFEFSEFNIESKTYFRDFYNLLCSNYNIYRVVKNGLYLIGNYNENLEVFQTSNFIAELK
jgi:hypothetical protein